MKITLNGEIRECTEGTTVEGLLDLYKLDKNRVAVELNSEIIPRKGFSTQILNEADVIEIVTFVGGG